MEDIYNALIDDESRDWFDAKIDYMITRNSDCFLNTLFALAKKYPREWHYIGMERFVKDKEYSGIIIYGCGHGGKFTKEILDLCGYSVACWCDSAKQKVGSDVNGLKVISTEELVEKYNDYLVVIGSTKYKEQIIERLGAFDFPLERTASYSDNTYDWAIGGNQYFDIFSPDCEEVYIDGGAYNGDTIFDFLEWNKENKYKVYSL